MVRRISIWQSPFVQVVLGTLTALAIYSLLPQWLAPPLPTAPPSQRHEPLQTQPAPSPSQPTTSLTCKSGYDALGALGTKTWYVRSVHSMPTGGWIVDVSETKPTMRDGVQYDPMRQCFIAPIGFAIPSAVRVRDGMLMAAD
jgi:hypothetical protein